MLNTEHWDVFSQDPPEWDKALEEQRKAVRKQQAINTAYKEFDKKYIPVVQENFEKLGYDKFREPEQLKVIFKYIKIFQQGGNTSQILVAPTGSGKTAILQVLALSLAQIDSGKRIAIALMSIYEVHVMTEFFEKNSQKVNKCRTEEQFCAAADSKIIITTHEVLALIGLHDNTGQLEDYMLLIDEIDRFSNAHELSFIGSNKIIQANKEGFIGFCSDPLSKKDFTEDGLGCQLGTEITLVNMGGDLKPEVEEVFTDLSGDPLYEYILGQSDSQKLVVCCKKPEEMRDVRKRILEHRNKEAVKKKAIIFDPEDDKKQFGAIWKQIQALDESDIDIVVTCMVAARSINFWKQCTVVAMFIFDEDRELRQLQGRSNREFPTKKKQRIIRVVNDETKQRQKDDKEKKVQMAEIKMEEMKNI